MEPAAPRPRSWFQRLVLALVPASWGAAMEESSRAWMVRCGCGHERSIWELGGIRWGASGRPRTLLRCPACGRRSWHVVERRA